MSVVIIMCPLISYPRSFVIFYHWEQFQQSDFLSSSILSWLFREPLRSSSSFSLRFGSLLFAPRLSAFSFRLRSTIPVRNLHCLSISVHHHVSLQVWLIYLPPSSRCWHWSSEDFWLKSRRSFVFFNGSNTSVSFVMDQQYFPSTNSLVWSSVSQSTQRCVRERVRLFWQKWKLIMRPAGICGRISWP